MKEIIDNFKEKGEKTISLLTGELNSVRAGRANPSLLDQIRVDYLLGQGPYVHLGAPARRAGDDLELALAQAHKLQQLGADLDLLHRRGGQGDPDRVADALGEQRAEGGAGLDGALEGGAGLGHPQVQGPVAPLGQQLVGLDHGDHVVVLDGDLEVVEAVLLE